MATSTNGIFPIDAISFLVLTLAGFISALAAWSVQVSNRDREAFLRMQQHFTGINEIGRNHQ